MSLEVSSLRAAAHPLRLRMLSLLTGAAMSAAEVARELDVTQANASYHLRILANAGLLEDAGEEKIRGGIAKRYRYRSDRSVKDDKTDAEGQFLRWQAVANELLRRAQLQGNSKTTKVVLCDAEVWVDEETWKRARDLSREASVLLHEKAMPPRSPGTKRVNATVALFEMRKK